MQRQSLLNEERLRRALVLLGAVQLALGLWMAISPGSFGDTVAGFGARNDHFLRDTATFYLALGGLLVLAARWRAWRVPALLFATLEYGLHAVNHLIDIGDADPGWVGPADLVSLAVVTAVFGYLLAVSWRESQ